MNVYVSRDVNQSHQSSLWYYLALAGGVFLLVMSLYLWFPAYMRVILASAFMFLGLSYTLLASRHSSRDFSFFLPILLSVLTIGLSLIFLQAVVILLLAGLLSITFSMIYHKSRSSFRVPVFFVTLALGILAGTCLLIVLSFFGLPNFYLGSFLLSVIVGLMVIDL